MNGKGWRSRRMAASALVTTAAVVMLGSNALASTPGADVRMSNDAPTTPGYVSDYTMVTGTPYTDATLSECSRSRGRENESSVAINPRNRQVIVGSSNDYCGVYNDGADSFGAPGLSPVVIPPKNPPSSGTPPVAAAAL